MTVVITSRVRQVITISSVFYIGCRRTCFLFTFYKTAHVPGNVSILGLNYIKNWPKPWQRFNFAWQNFNYHLFWLALCELPITLFFRIFTGGSFGTCFIKKAYCMMILLTIKIRYCFILFITPIYICQIRSINIIENKIIQKYKKIKKNETKKY